MTKLRTETEGRGWEENYKAMTENLKGGQSDGENWSTEVILPAKDGGGGGGVDRGEADGSDRRGAFSSPNKHTTKCLFLFCFFSVTPIFSCVTRRSQIALFTLLVRVLDVLCVCCVCFVGTVVNTFIIGFGLPRFARLLHSVLAPSFIFVFFLFLFSP